jgi:hypothetical protein
MWLWVDNNFSERKYKTVMEHSTDLLPSTAENPDAEAVSAENGRRTWRQLESKARRFAQGVVERGGDQTNSWFGHVYGGGPEIGIYSWNPYSDKTFKAIESDPNLSDEKANAELKKLIVYTIEQAPAVILPQPYAYAVWWPWVKNYYGEMRVGQQSSGPIHARIWIDQELKKKMGY